MWDKVPGGSLGSRLASAEIAGVPVSVVIGPDDVAAGTVTVKWRTDRDKVKIKADALVGHIAERAAEFDKSLYAAAAARMKTQIVAVNDLGSLNDAIASGKVALAPWGGSAADEVALKKQAGITARCIKEPLAEGAARCFFTGRPAAHLVYFGRAY